MATAKKPPANGRKKKTVALTPAEADKQARHEKREALRKLQGIA